jgi:viroplasmin and RNaseH domain-containing protein
MTRPIKVIAQDIRANWPKVNYAAKPYLDAMSSLNSIDENYMFDSGKSVVNYFLSNANTWRGEKAREIKAELKAML